MLKTPQCALARQCRTALLVPLHIARQQHQYRIVPQIIVIAQIIVSQGNARYALCYQQKPLDWDLLVPMSRTGFIDPVPAV